MWMGLRSPNAGGGIFCSFIPGAFVRTSRHSSKASSWKRSGACRYQKSHTSKCDGLLGEHYGDLVTFLPEGGGHHALGATFKFLGS